jgi:hypothetical protein
MVLSTLPLDCASQYAIDWLEYKILCSEYGIGSVSELQRIWDTRRNSEDDDFEGADSDAEVFLQNMSAEILSRVRQLEEAYPFELSPNGGTLSLKEDLSPGAYIYLFCLFLSHPKKGAVLNGKYLPKITNEVRDLFQACSTWAAAALVRGHSYSFGFPRPDGSGFLKKLQIIYNKFGEGKVVDTIPKGASRRPKDEQIDVIAWKDRPDGAAGKIYILGQVASGNDWPNKTIKGAAISRFHGTWFSNPQVASEASAALFIPFCVVPEDGDTTAERVNILTLEFGKIYYRHLLPLLAQQGIEHCKNSPDCVVERVTDIDKITKWVDFELSKLRKKAA